VLRFIILALGVCPITGSCGCGYSLYDSPHLHLTTSKVNGDCLEVKREYYENCFIYCQCATSSMGTVNKNSSYIPVGPGVCLFVFFGLHDLSLCWCMFCLGQLSHFPSCCGAGLTNLNEPPSSFVLPPHYCGLGAGSIPLRAIVNKKQCETRGYLCRWSSTTE